MKRRSLHSAGFTLVELLVVVAIVVLLISILMPSLSHARDQAKTVKCVGQLKEVGLAMHMYFSDHNNWFPFEKRNELMYIHGFYYGGHPGRRPWWGYKEEEWRDTPAGRPFNPYLYPDLPNWDVKRKTDPVLFKQVREDLAIYQCPSDVGGYWNTQTDDDESLEPTHWTTGSSYDFNYHFVLRWAISYRPPGPPIWKFWLQRGNAFLKKQFAYHSSTFIMLYEDPFDSAQWNNIPRRGWHRQWNEHSFLFLDGHAANMRTDTTRGNRGKGWKTASGWWWEDPDDPDYEYRDLRP